MISEGWGSIAEPLPLDVQGGIQGGLERVVNCDVDDWNDGL